MEFKVIEQQCIFEVDLYIYEIDVICKAAYQFIDETYVYFDMINENTVKVFLESKQPLLEDELITLGKTFLNELLSQKVRYGVSKQTKNIRELILGRALYSTCLEVETELETIEENTLKYVEDEEDTTPDLEDIAVSWFEQYFKE